MRIIPRGRRVLVRKDSVEDTFGNDVKFYKPYSTKESEHARQAYGTVIEVAEEAYEDVYQKKQCGAGDRVIFRAHAGVLASEEDEDLILLNDQDILAIIVEDE